MKNYWLDLRKPAGFPQDDEFSMMQGCNGTANLDLWYNTQFVQNEWLGLATHQRLLSTHKTNFHPAEYTPIVPSSMTGTIYLGDTAIQTFIHYSDERFELQDLVVSEIKVIKGELLLTTGELTLQWNAKPADCRVIVSYEYNLECQA